MVNNGYMEFEPPSVWLIKQEVSGKHRETKDRTGKVSHEPGPLTSAGEQPAAPGTDGHSETQQVECFMWDLLAPFFLRLETLSLVN